MVSIISFDIEGFEGFFLVVLVVFIGFFVFLFVEGFLGGVIVVGMGGVILDMVRLGKD